MIKIIINDKFTVALMLKYAKICEIRPNQTKTRIFSTYFIKNLYHFLLCSTYTILLQIDVAEMMKNARCASTNSQKLCTCECKACHKYRIYVPKFNFPFEGVAGIYIEKVNLKESSRGGFELNSMFLLLHMRIPDYPLRSFTDIGTQKISLLAIQYEMVQASSQPIL